MQISRNFKDPCEILKDFQFEILDQGSLKSNTIPRPATERIPPSLKVEDDPLVETLEESTEAIEFESGRNPLLSDQDFNKFFPSWSRKKRATLIQESRLFNVTGLGFGTISYPWTDVIGKVVVGQFLMKNRYV